MTQTQERWVDPTVNDVIEAWPATVEVFQRHGVDSCCGGALPLSTVAERHGLVLAALRAELSEAGAQLSAS